MKSFEVILALFLRSLDPATPHLAAAEYGLEQLADCRLAADALHVGVQGSPTVEPGTLDALVQVRDAALAGMTGLVADLPALEAADGRARQRLTVLSDEAVMELFGDCAVAFGAVTDD